MAADGRMCSGDLIVNDATAKIFHAKDGSVVGCSGDAALGELIRKWFEDGENTSRIPKIELTADDPNPVSVLILRPDGRVQWMNHHFAVVPHASPMAIGSGAEVAIGLLRNGWSPVEAIKAVAEVITSVGGEMVELSPRKPKLKAKRGKR